MSLLIWVRPSKRQVGLAGADDLIVVTGSLFTIGEAREYLVQG